jgi:hypothetical protein
MMGGSGSVPLTNGSGRFKNVGSGSGFKILITVLSIFLYLLYNGRFSFVNDPFFLGTSAGQKRVNNMFLQKPEPCEVQEFSMN